MSRYRPETVAVVVVTFNRADLLARMLGASPPSTTGPTR